MEAEQSDSKGDSRRKLVTALILSFINFIYYADRYGIAGIITDIQCEFDANDSQAGLLQTVYVIGFIVGAPIVGYLGDRFSRKWIIVFGMLLWSAAALTASFMQDFAAFVTMRTLLGLGEACYTPLVPGILSDLYSKEQRSKYLGLYFLASSVGGGFGFVLFSLVADWTNDWRWGLRVTPFAGFLAVILVFFFVLDPPRGQSDGNQAIKITSLKTDLKYLIKISTFFKIIIGSVGIDYFLSSFAAFGPKYITLGLIIQKLGVEEFDPNTIFSRLSALFGIVTMCTGVLGVITGSVLGFKLRGKYPTVDAVICGFGSLISVPVLFTMFLLASGPLFFTVMAGCIGTFFIDMYWALANDMLMGIVVPTRRASAKAIHSLLDHVVGGALGPFLTGVLSDVFKPLIDDASGNSVVAYVEQDCAESTINLDTIQRDFLSIQYAYFVSVFFLLIGAASFVSATWSIVADKAAAEKASREIGDGIELNGKTSTTTVESIKQLQNLNETSEIKSQDSGTLP